jgi:N-sulfoglucosamine sulfohydrolase
MENYYQFIKEGFVCSMFLTGILPSCQTEQKKDTQIQFPNIVLMIADDLGTDDLGVYGNPAIPTPNLDYLASQGMIFTNAYCTSASCSASRSVVLTGLYNHANGQFGHSHDFHHFKTFENVISLPQILKDAGYITGRIGKFHIAPDEIYPFDSIMPANARSSVEMANRSKSFIESATQPFFLYFCTDDPHRGGGIAEEIPTQPDRFGNRPEGYPGVETRLFQPEDVIVPEYLPDNLATRHELAQYYQSVNRMDQGFGRLFDVLKETGNWENTIVIFLSDNGIAFPGAKTNLYDPAMRLPLVFYYPPLIEKGSVSNAMVNWTYLTPTILDILGILPEDDSIPGQFQRDENYQRWLYPPLNEKFHGKSFKTALSGNPEGFDEIYASHTFHEITMYYPMRVLQDRQYKFIWNIASGLEYPHASDLWESSTWSSVSGNMNNKLGKRKIEDYIKRPEFELYDMANDPYEIVNLAYQSDFANLLEEYKEKIRQFQQNTSDPWIVKWEHE